eukprot:gene7750-2958_t
MDVPPKVSGQTPTKKTVPHFCLAADWVCTAFYDLNGGWRPLCFPASACKLPDLKKGSAKRKAGPQAVREELAGSPGELAIQGNVGGFTLGISNVIAITL